MKKRDFPSPRCSFLAPVLVPVSSVMLCIPPSQRGLILAWSEALYCSEARVGAPGFKKNSRAPHDLVYVLHTLVISGLI